MTAKTEIGPFDALDKALPNEPRFVLLARDPAAPAAITEWARIRRNLAYKRFGDSPRKRDRTVFEAELAQAAQAEEIAERMQVWRAGEGSEHDEESQAEKATYNEAKRSAEELAEARRIERVKALCKHWREAAYHLCEGMDGFAEMGLISDADKAMFAAWLETLNFATDNLEPKRA